MADRCVLEDMKKAPSLLLGEMKLRQCHFVGLEEYLLESLCHEIKTHILSL